MYNILQSAKYKIVMLKHSIVEEYQYTRIPEFQNTQKK